MATYLVSNIWEIDYAVLSKYHFTAQIINENYIKKKRSTVEDYEFTLAIEANSEEASLEKFADYGKFLYEKGVSDHIFHIIYLTQKTMEFEGNTKNELKDYKYILGELNLLSSLLSLRGDKKTQITLEHKNFGKGYEHYVFVDNNNQDLIPIAIDALVDGVLKRIKSNKNQLPNNLAIMEEDFNEITLEKVSELKRQCVDVSEKTFNSLLLYTVSKTLQKYLNNETTLSKKGVTLTNDQVRVIYATCEFFGLIPDEREMDYDRVNYMKSVFKNKKDDQSIKIQVV